MESKVQLSKFAFILTLSLNIILIVCCFALINETPKFWIVFGLLILLLFLGLLYGPAQLTTNPEYVIVKTYLLKHKILVRDIESVELFRPSRGSMRLFASGGYFGYWGIFRDLIIGTYAAYFGKPSDCFLVRMKNGSKYVLGCENPEEMVKYIQNQIR